MKRQHNQLFKRRISDFKIWRNSQILNFLITKKVKCHHISKVKNPECKNLPCMSHYNYFKSTHYIMLTNKLFDFSQMIRKWWQIIQEKNWPNNIKKAKQHPPQHVSQPANWQGSGQQQPQLIQMLNNSSNWKTTQRECLRTNRHEKQYIYCT